MLSFEEGERISFEIGTHRWRKWMHFGRRWTRGVGILKIGEFSWTPSVNHSLNEKCSSNSYGSQLRQPIGYRVAKLTNLKKKKVTGNRDTMPREALRHIQFCNSCNPLTHASLVRIQNQAWLNYDSTIQKLFLSSWLVFEW